MDKKYKISKLKDFNVWSKFENDSPQSSIYSSIDSIQTFQKNLVAYNQYQAYKSLDYILLSVI